MHKKILFSCCLLALASCKKTQVESLKTIYGTYVGKTHLVGVGTPRAYDTTMDESFVISSYEENVIWIESLGRFGSTYGFASDITPDNVYYQNCDSSDEYHILPETQELVVKTRFTAGMGGMIHTEYRGKKAMQ